jgi:hypothetical protein
MAREKEISIVNRPLADMHVDGVRFDPKIKEALKNQRKLNQQKQNKA